MKIVLSFTYNNIIKDTLYCTGRIAENKPPIPHIFPYVLVCIQASLEKAQVSQAEQQKVFFFIFHQDYRFSLIILKKND